jgi:hypothetical protein
VQKQTLVEAAAIEEGIKQQITGALLGEQAERPGELGAEG